MNSVDNAEFIANNDAEYLGAMVAISLIAGTAVTRRAVERSRGNRHAHGGSPLGRKPSRDRGMKDVGNLLNRRYFSRTGDATPRFTDAEFERRFHMPRTTYETVRSAVLKTSKFKALYKQAGSVWFHPSPMPALSAPPTALALPPAIRGNCCRGRRAWRAGSEEGVPCKERERGWGWWWWSRGAVPRDGAQRAYPVGNKRKSALFAGNEFVQKLAQSTVWARNLPEVRHFGQILVQIQTLDLKKGPLENVLSFPNLKFSLDENNLHRWRCSNTPAGGDSLDMWRLPSISPYIFISVAQIEAQKAAFSIRTFAVEFQVYVCKTLETETARTG
jgi:hypothetical protein